MLLDHNNVITRQEILTVRDSQTEPYQSFDVRSVRESLFEVVRSIGDDTPEERVERVFGLMARVSHNHGFKDQKAAVLESTQFS